MTQVGLKVTVGSTKEEGEGKWNGNVWLMSLKARHHGEEENEREVDFLEEISA